MLTIIDIPDFLEEMYETSKIYASSITKEMYSIGKRERFEKNIDLLEVEDEAYYYIHDGFYKFIHGENVTRYFYNGDLVLAGKKDYLKNCKLIADLGTDVSVFPKRLFIGKLHNNLELLRDWVKYQELEMNIRNILCSLYMSHELKPDISVKLYKYGEVIITEGDKPNGIFVLVDGEVRVTSEGVKVGTIKTGEVFGEISFLTGNVRTATVVAKTNCMIQFINKNNFVLLIKYKPQFFLTISKNLAKRVVALNKQVVNNYT